MQAACHAHGRAPSDVQVLLAVKTLDAETIRQALDLNHRLLGHNRVQEMAAVEPMLTVPHTTHFIGQLQSNKINHAVRFASCIHSVDSERLAQRMDAALARLGERRQVMIQVNTSAEESKAGVAPEAALDLIHTANALEHVDVVGLMCIGANSPQDPARVRRSYADLRRLRDRAQSDGLTQVRELSMGMSQDFEMAIGEGATIIRIGSRVFGPRSVPNRG